MKQIASGEKKPNFSPAYDQPLCFFAIVDCRSLKLADI
jgi:hypothetical protein